MPSFEFVDIIDAAKQRRGRLIMLQSSWQWFYKSDLQGYLTRTINVNVSHNNDYNGRMEQGSIAGIGRGNLVVSSLGMHFKHDEIVADVTEIVEPSVLIEFFSQHSPDATRNSVFLNLFCTNLTPQRFKTLSKLVGTAVSGSVAPLLLTFTYSSIARNLSTRQCQCEANIYLFICPRDEQPTREILNCNVQLMAKKESKKDVYTCTSRVIEHREGSRHFQ
uniref:Uncharacterized protein n=1 Tax=Glossina pallidipes TaxID=7398 RepID=A0A1A9ZJG6_GLOPL